MAQEESRRAYNQDLALAEGLAYLPRLDAALKKLNIKNEERRALYAQEVNSLRAYDCPDKITIAVCGSTGAGKSTLINAVLGEELLPTSSVRACTTVVTEISHSPEDKRTARIDFLSSDEWQAELDSFITDIQDDNGAFPKRTSDIHKEFKKTWDKIHAVYPKLAFAELSKLTGHEIVRKYPAVEAYLGSQEIVEASTTKDFSRQMRTYLHASSGSQTPALWPLIRRVRIKCPAPALATGAILVDLPGSGDTNAARCAIAKEYSQQCDHFWIVAATHRASDEKVAQGLLSRAFKAQLSLDGRLSQQAITFIGTKCDDMPAGSEGFDDFGLEDDPEYGEMSLRHARCKEILEDLEEAQCLDERGAAIQAAEKALAQDRADLAKYRHARRQTPDLPSAGKPALGQVQVVGQPAGPGALKRTVSEMIKDETIGTPEPSFARKRPRRSESGTGDGASGGDVSAKEESPSVAPPVVKSELDEKITSLEAKIRENEQLHYELLTQFGRAKSTHEKAVQEVMELEAQMQAQRLRARSSYVRSCLQQEYRSNILSWTAAGDASEPSDDGSSDAGSSEESQEDELQADAAQPELPVFMVSSREYMRMRADGSTRGANRAPSGFLTIADTGIPGLQEWCHALTLPRREADALAYMSKLRPFVSSLQTFIEGAPQIKEKDRRALQAKYQPRKAKSTSKGLKLASPESADPSPGLSALLQTGLEALAEECVDNLRKEFKAELHEKCEGAAEAAAEQAYKITDQFPLSMRWQTYSATLRRDGDWRDYNLNYDLAAPFAEHIADTWCTIFRTHHFASFERKAAQHVQDVVGQVVADAPPYLTERAERQRESCLDEARAKLSDILEAAERALRQRRGGIFQCLVAHIQRELHEGYGQASAIRGSGSLAKKKVIMKEYVHSKRHLMFQGAADIIRDKLADAADAIKSALDGSLRALSLNAEINLAVLWERQFEDDDRGATRNATLQLLVEILKGVDAWEAARCRRTAEGAGEATMEVST